MNNMDKLWIVVSVAVVGIAIIDTVKYFIKLPFRILSWFGRLPPIEWFGESVLTPVLLRTPFTLIGKLDDIVNGRVGKSSNISI